MPWIICTKKEETTKDGKGSLQSIFKNLNSNVNQNVDGQTDGKTKN